ncbi:hypothetical protein [Solimicrobium silvestre]|uniref:Uncharacterized protein n=1 Tax=Solimicrobium silvestre TaxID=2099400 RepID=A0A2S9GYB1_9BURK|nr:hypothetical protein [Solimicrobium silvestre]PRC92646.1 hypothetical protein S2091_2701 [Solimicrobium silvestre]
MKKSLRILKAFNLAALLLALFLIADFCSGWAGIALLILIFTLFFTSHAEGMADQYRKSVDDDLNPPGAPVTDFPELNL